MKGYLTIGIMFFLSVGFSQEMKLASEVFPLTSIPAKIFEKEATEVQSKPSVLVTPKRPAHFEYDVPKIDFSEKKTYFQQNLHTGHYDSFIFYDGEIRKDRTYLTLVDVPRNCFSTSLHGTAGPGDLVGAFLQAVIDDLDLDFKIGKIHFTFEE